MDYLLEPDFPGRDALREQLATARVEELDECPCLKFNVSGPAIAEVKCRVPIEAHSASGDVNVLLHVVEGRLDELEFVHFDPSRPLRMPAPRELRRFCPTDWTID
jgi:hypothetical protein